MPSHFQHRSAHSALDLARFISSTTRPSAGASVAQQHLRPARAACQPILALTDFSAADDDALERAAAIAAVQGVVLHLMHVTDAPNERMADRATWLSQRAQQLARRYDISVIALPRPAAALADVIEQSRRASLIVLNTLGNRCFRGSLRGKAYEQVARHSQCPVLLARTPAERAYGRALVAFGTASELGDLSRYARRFESGVSAMAVQVFVAKLVAAGELGPAGAQTGSWRVRCARLLARWLNGAHGGLGQANVVAQLIERRAELGADLVLAPRFAPPITGGLGWSDAARRLVRELDCDLLLVPSTTEAYPANLPSMPGTDASGAASLPRNVAPGA